MVKRSAPASFFYRRREYYVRAISYSFNQSPVTFAAIGKQYVEPYSPWTAQRYCFQYLRYAVAVAFSNVDNHYIAIKCSNMAAVGYFIVEIINREVISIRR